MKNKFEANDPAKDIKKYYFFNLKANRFKISYVLFRIIIRLLLKGKIILISHYPDDGDGNVGLYLK